MTKLNEDMLRQIATNGKGSYVGANNASAGVEKVFNEINRLDKTLLEQRNISDYESRYQIPLFMAIICLILEIVTLSRQHRRLNRKNLFGMKNARPAATTATVTLLLLIGAAPAPLQAQVVPLTHTGNRLYQKEDYTAAEEAYRKGLALDSTQSRLLYNLGNAQYKQGLYPQAAELYNKVLQAPHLSRQERAQAAHNLGNAYVQTQAYPEAIDAYKQALRQQPNDADTKYNLAYAQKLLQQQQQQQQNKQDQQNQQDQQQKQDQQNQQNQQNQNGDGQPQPAEDQQPPQNRPDQGQGRESQEDQRKKNEAEKILQALENQEKKTLDKVHKKEMPARKKHTEKDW